MRYRLLILLLWLAVLSGCGVSPLRQIGPLEELKEPGVQAQETPELPEALFPQDAPANLWAREQLPESVQEAYDMISAAIAAREEGPVNVRAGESDIHLILSAVRVDHPEYYWFDGVTSFVTTSFPGIGERTACSFTYSMTKPEILEAHWKIEDYTRRCFTEAAGTGASTDYEKILEVYRYIIRNTDYISEEPDQSIVSVMDGHRATCAGYARSFQYLMHRMNIPCILAVGDGPSGDAHGWNYVQCGGEWYQIDVTWGDPVDEDGSPGNTLQYTYCMLTDAEMFRDHKLSGEIAMPVCTSDTYNYFVQAGRQMETWDPEGYAGAMALAAEQGEPWFSVRFTSRAAYETACYALFDQEEIWTILEAVGAADLLDTRVVYSQNDLFYEIAVRLDG